MTTVDPLRLARACAQHMLALDRASRDLGMSVEIPEPGSAIVRMAVTPGLVNGHDLCHGGYVFTLADSAFAFACNAYNRVAVSAAASIDYVAPARGGDRLVAHATELWRGRRNGVYDVVVTRAGDDATLAHFRGRCAIGNTPVLAGGSAPD